MADTTLQLLSEHGCFGGVQRFYEHDSGARGRPVRESPPSGGSEQGIHASVEANT